MTRRHELRLTVPGNSHVEFDVPEEMTGEVRIIVEQLSPAAADQGDDVPSAEQRAQSLAIALEMQRTSPVINTADIVATIREGRD
jgi:hypothetical protein